MNNNNTWVKVVFGGIIFLFSVALAYFTANYLSDTLGTGESSAEAIYWVSLISAAGLYIVIGLIVARVFPVSLGFLFSADVVVLHALFSEFGNISDEIKLGVLGIVLAIIYGVAVSKLDKPIVTTHQSPQQEPEPESVNFNL